MPVISAQYQGIDAYFNNRNITPKIKYNLLTCQLFCKLNRNMIFLIVTLFFSEFCPLKQFRYKNKNYCLVLITFLTLIVIIFIQFIWVHALLIRQSGNIEMNPGSRPNLKLPAYVVIKKLDVICLSETYLDSYNLSDDDNFNLSGYNLVRTNHPS